MSSGPLPIRAALRSDGLYLALRAVDTAELVDPFLQTSVDRCTGIDSLIQVPASTLVIPDQRDLPSGIIFHVARCGSTLVSQLLRQVGTHVVYAEPLAFNDLLAPPHEGPSAHRIWALRATATAFARHARRPYILKLSSWNTLFSGLLTEAFPETPWILCVRDPLEVAVSLLRTPPSWLQRGAATANLFRGVVDPKGQCSDAETYLATLFASMCENVTQLDTAHGQLVEYDSLPDAVAQSVSSHFGLFIDSAARNRMSAAAHFNAKSPTTGMSRFRSDTADKRAAATPLLHRAVEYIARPALERLRRHFAQSGSAS
jgi:hypothetical protein